MRKITVLTVYKVLRIFFILLIIAGLFFLVGFIGNADYCTEAGLECEIGLPHLFGASGIALLGVAGYKFIKWLEDNL